MGKDRGGCKFIKVDFLLGEMSKFLAVGWDFPTIFRVSNKGLGKWGTVHTWQGQQSNINGGGIFGQKKIQGYSCGR